jgi:ATP adenylyltransferase
VRDIIAAVAGSTIRLERGTLWKATVERTAAALRCGALEPIATRCEAVAADGADFVVRVLSHLDRKHDALAAQRREGRNPFLPYDEDLFVAEVTDTHLCLLNKFNVIDHHLLLVTRAFEEQESPLTPADFEALEVCMDEFDAFAFYNSGRVAGASQPHKHLQLVPVPIGLGPERTPIDRWLDAPSPKLGFRYAFTRLESGADLYSLYRDLAGAVDLDRSPRPYNLLVTRDWMLLVPRSRASYEGVFVNALGFAGGFLVGSREQLDRVRELGPLRILEAVAESRPPGP